MILFIKFIFELINLFVTRLCVVVSVAFFTLIERKVLSLGQIRKGPNKNSIIGLGQPMIDAIKLLMKEFAELNFSNFCLYYIIPIFNLVVVLLLWYVICDMYMIYWIKWSILSFLCISSLNIYRLAGRGWSSNSKYSLLGRIRGIAQVISYEIRLILVIICFLLICHTFDFFRVIKNQLFIWVILLVPYICIIWICRCIAEVNRAPFDFAEGESELVSGFNIEFSGGGFALIFIREYGSILLFSYLSSLLIFGGNSFFGVEFFLFTWLKFLVLIYIFLWARLTFPRYRYDLLIILVWKSFLPLVLIVLWVIRRILFFFS